MTSQLLNQHENALLSRTAAQKRCEAWATAVVRLYFAVKVNNQSYQWIHKETGVALMVKDRDRKGYFIQVDINIIK